MDENGKGLQNHPWLPKLDFHIMAERWHVWVVPEVAEYKANQDEELEDGEAEEDEDMDEQDKDDDEEEADEAEVEYIEMWGCWRDRPTLPGD